MGFLRFYGGQLSQGKCIAIVLIRKGLQLATVSSSCKLRPLTGRPQWGEGVQDDLWKIARWTHV